MVVVMTMMTMLTMTMMTMMMMMMMTTMMMIVMGKNPRRTCFLVPSQAGIFLCCALVDVVAQSGLPFSTFTHRALDGLESRVTNGIRLRVGRRLLDKCLKIIESTGHSSWYGSAVLQFRQSVVVAPVVNVGEVAVPAIGKKAAARVAAFLD